MLRAGTAKRGAPTPERGGIAGKSGATEESQKPIDKLLTEGKGPDNVPTLSCAAQVPMQCWTTFSGFEGATS